MPVIVDVLSHMEEAEHKYNIDQSMVNEQPITALYTNYNVVYTPMQETW